MYMTICLKDRASDKSCCFQFHVDGLVISNTTITRPPTLKSLKKEEAGGLSGPPLKDLATEATRDMYRLTQGAV